MAIFGTLNTVRLQAGQHLRVRKALEYVEALQRIGSAERTRLMGLASNETMRIELGDGLVAIDAAYMSKRRNEVFFETHQKFVDVQAVLEGEESMEIVDRSRLKVDVPYDAARDLVKYADAIGASILHAFSGEVAVFFPEDGHMSHAVAEPVLVRKTVVKVPV